MGANYESGSSIANQIFSPRGFLLKKSNFHVGKICMRLAFALTWSPKVALHFSFENSFRFGCFSPTNLVPYLSGYFICICCTLCDVYTPIEEEKCQKILDTLPKSITTSKQFLQITKHILTRKREPTSSEEWTRAAPWFDLTVLLDSALLTLAQEPDPAIRSFLEPSICTTNRPQLTLTLTRALTIPLNRKLPKRTEYHFFKTRPILAPSPKTCTLGQTSPREGTHKMFVDMSPFVDLYFDFFIKIK